YPRTCAGALTGASAISEAARISKPFLIVVTSAYSGAIAWPNRKFSCCQRVSPTSMGVDWPWSTALAESSHRGAAAWQFEATATEPLKRHIKIEHSNS